jgi:hypothetical protein
MKAFILFISIFVIAAEGVYSQWETKYTSIPFYEGVISGWMNFHKNKDDWENRIYYLDATSFNIMSNTYSNEVEYTYNFTPEEIAAGYNIYSLRADLTGDGVVEFYIMSAYGMSSNYRYGFKIIDLVNGTVIFQKNEAEYSYSTPAVWDIDNDKYLECSVKRTTYPIATYSYQVVFNTGCIILDAAPTGMIPAAFELKQNYPNPFNPLTTIEFNLGSSADVSLEVYDIKGSLVRTLINRHMEKGDHKVVWDGKNNSGVKASSGVYMYRIDTEAKTDIKKMIVLK